MKIGEKETGMIISWKMNGLSGFLIA